MASKPAHIKIQTAIDHFLSIVLNQEDKPEDLGILMSSLDELAYSVRLVGDEFDETDYLDPPETDYPAIRETIKKRFPTLDWYNMATHISEPNGETKLFLRDAIDDLVDIVSDLQKISWRFENTSEDDASWHFQWGYMNTWGRALRFLQLYLHDFWW
ncbi:DUF5063 domain-containing protein [Methylotuvimicrobium buryatense]|nr:DUF5063 domain-containing protein [Methylotuvimicrobium buryatense]